MKVYVVANNGTDALEEPYVTNNYGAALVTFARTVGEYLEDDTLRVQLLGIVDEQVANGFDQCYFALHHHMHNDWQRASLNLPVLAWEVEVHQV